MSFHKNLLSNAKEIIKMGKDFGGGLLDENTTVPHPPGESLSTSTDVLDAFIRIEAFPKDVQAFKSEMADRARRGGGGGNQDAFFSFIKATGKKPPDSKETGLGSTLTKDEYDKVLKAGLYKGAPIIYKNGKPGINGAGALTVFKQDIRHHEATARTFFGPNTYDRMDFEMKVLGIRLSYKGSLTGQDSFKRLIAGIKATVHSPDLQDKIRVLHRNRAKAKKGETELRTIQDVLQSELAGLKSGKNDEFKIMKEKFLDPFINRRINTGPSFFEKAVDAGKNLFN